MQHNVDEAGLIYVTDSQPGISRRRSGRGFSYRLPDGSTLKRKQERTRIETLGIPPAYENVWICMKANGHIQATGLDARGRKQYRYHPVWSDYRAKRKFDGLLDFADRLPRIRRHVKRDLEGKPGDLEYTLAALTMLLENAPMRVGSREYAKENNTYGATTLLRRHVRFKDDALCLDFRSKGGKRVRRSMRHKRLQKIMEGIADLPGRELFTWKTGDGDFAPVDSARFNAYLADISDSETITAKTFRTWAGTLAAFRNAISCHADDIRPSVKSLSEAAADELCNTATISRNSYIHPAVIDLAKDENDSIVQFEAALGKPKKRSGLLADEQRLAAFLEKVSI